MAIGCIAKSDAPVRSRAPRIYRRRVARGWMWALDWNVRAAEIEGEENV